MKILDVPKEFQIHYTSTYPGYSSGRNMEEIFYEMFKNNKDTIQTDLIYIPVFWTSYYVTHNYANNIQSIYNWLDTLDKTKKYFTIVQYASGIFIKNKDYKLDLIVFSAGGGGVNVKGPSSEKKLTYDGLTRHIFCGDKGHYDIPLMCLPLFPSINCKKDIYCSFIGRFDTHYSRINTYNTLHKNEKFKFSKSVNFEKYNEILNRSIFTLAPRGYGYTSFRIYEAIMADSIPIYIWQDKKILPFDDVINWENFCIIIHDDDIEKLPEILDNVNISEKQKNLQKVKHRFTFNETFKYIKDKIK